MGQQLSKTPRLRTSFGNHNKNTSTSSPPSTELQTQNKFDDINKSSESSSNPNSSNQHSSNSTPGNSFPQAQNTQSSSRSTYFKWMEDGRIRHNVKGSLYMLAADDTELDRVSMQHYMIKVAFQGLFTAPVHELLLQHDTKILDVGTGTGAWPLEVATEYPNVEIQGIDMVPVYPMEVKPPNCFFSTQNVIDGLNFPDNSFDYVHIQMLILGLTIEQWGSALKELYRLTKPGGYIEIRDMDMQPFKAGRLYTELLGRILKAVTARSMDPHLGLNVHRYLAEATGISDVKVKVASYPIGAWGGRHGELMKENTIQGIKSMKHFLSAVWGVTSDQFDDTITAAVQEADKHRGYYNYYAVYIQKPFQ